MSEYRIVTLPGDGIGPEVTESAVAVLNAAAAAHGGVRLEFDEHDAGSARWQRTGVAMPDSTMQACADADAILMGAIGLPEARHADGREVNGEVIFRLRFEFDLYAGIRPVKTYPNVPSPLRSREAIDYVVIRENVEGLYASRAGGTNVRDEVATDTLVITATGTRKVSNVAFRLAQKRNGKRHVTCVDKSNVLSSYAFFRKIFDETAGEYPDISADHAYVDAMTAYQVLKPEIFDVVVAENMFGDIISDLAGATVGGLGLAASGDVGDTHGMFQPAHGSAPDIVGRGIANPVATILSGAMMLEWLGDRSGDKSAHEVAKNINEAIDRVMGDGATLTPDLRGTASTTDVTSAVIKALT